VSLILGVISIGLLFTSFGLTMLGAILTFFYPAFMSYKSLTNMKKSDDQSKAQSEGDMKKWLSYWAIFSFWRLFDDVIHFCFSWFPMFGLLEAVLFVLLYNGKTNGSLKIYEMLVAPWFDAIDSKVGPCIQCFEKVLKISG